MFEDLLPFLSDIGSIAKTGSAVVDLISKVKRLLNNGGAAQTGQAGYFPSPPVANFQPQMANPYGNGNQWLPYLQALARQNGNPWVPNTTMQFMGINLTGIWVPPGNPYDQTFIRQYGPYLNIIAGVAGTPTVYAEGLYNPNNFCLQAIGCTTTGGRFEATGQLLQNWQIQGWTTVTGPFGQFIQTPYLIGKVA